MLREIHLHGARAETFLLDVESAAEAVRALITIRPELRGHFHANDWRVMLGDQYAGYALGIDELGARAGRQAIHFLPELVVAGGRSGAIGKIIIGAVLIAAAVFAPALGLGIAAGGGLAAIGITQSVVMGMGISMVLGGTAMLLSPTPKAPKATEQANPEERPSFFFNGPVNTSEPGVPVPLAYGYFRCGSVVINAGVWNEDISAEENTAAATASPAVGPGLGRLPRNDPLIPAPGEFPPEPAPLEAQPIFVSKGGGKGGTPGAAYAPQEAPNTLRSRSLVRLHEILSEGVIQGPPDPTWWGRFIYFDDTPLMASDGSFNFRLSGAHLRYGYPQESPIPGFPSSEVTVNVGAQVFYGAPLVRGVQSPDTTMIRLQIHLPRLMYQHPNGDLIGTGVDIQIEYQVAGEPWALVVWDRILGKTTTGYQRSYSFWLPPRDGRHIDLRVTRLSINSEDVEPGTAYNDTWWQSTVEIIDGQMRHDDSAAAAFVVDAEEFPSIPRRAYQFYWLRMKVPTNYNPWTRAYTGTWDGTFKEEWTNNPAWILYDLLTHPAHGLGRDLDAMTVDKWSFYEAAYYNDGGVSNGKGGVEPRFTFNAVLNTQEEAAGVLQAVASSMRAQFYVAGGIIMLAQDRPPARFERILAPANVEGGTFDYQSTEARSRTTVCNVSWIDPDHNWQPQVEPVPFPDMLGRFGYRELGITAMGCTSRAQAIRHGRHFLFSAHYEQETVSFVTGLENCDLRPGDVIGIQDPSRAAIEWSGRVVRRDGDVITLDRPVAGAPAGAMWFSPQWTPGQFPWVVGSNILFWQSPTQVRVANSVGDYININTDAVWAISSSTANLRQWRVLSVAEQEGLRFQVTATVHDPRKYTFVEQNVTLPDISYDALPSGPLGPPTSPRGEDYYTLDPSGMSQAGLLFSWTPSTDPRVISYIADAFTSGRVGTHWQSLNNSSVVLERAETGEWTFYVKGVDAIGRTSAIASVTVNTATIARVPLPPFNFFAGVMLAGSAFLQWQKPDDLSISHWWLKWTPELAEPRWDAAVTVQASIPARLLSLVLPAQPGSFLLKSVSVRGVESATAAVAQFRMSDIRPVGASRIEQPTWAATRTNCYVNLGELVMDPLPATLLSAQAVSLPVPFAHRPVRVGAEPLNSMEYLTAPLSLTQTAEAISRVLIAGRGVIDADIMANWIPLAVAVPLSRTASADWEATVDERTSLDGTTFGAWRPAGMTSEVIRAAQYRLRGAVFAAGVALRFSRMEESLMLVGYEQVGTATTNASGVVSVAFDPDFYLAPEVTTNVVGGGAVNLLLTAVSATGFTVNSVTPAGAVAPSITFNWRARGYGRQNL